MQLTFRIGGVPVKVPGELRRASNGALILLLPEIDHFMSSTMDICTGYAYLGRIGPPRGTIFPYKETLQSTKPVIRKTADVQEFLDAIPFYEMTIRYMVLRKCERSLLWKFFGIKTREHVWASR